MDTRKYFLDWPREVSIETFAKCNAACTFCPYTTLERIGTKMPDEVLDRIIEELKDHPWPFIIAPFKVNEPLLDKRLLPFCRKINEELPNAYLRIFTNGSTLTLPNITEIASLSQVHHLWVSLNDHRPVEYKKLMRLPFERTAENLDALHAAKCAGMFGHEVVLSKVATEGLRDPLQAEFTAYCEDRWPQFTVRLIKPDAWLGNVPYGSPDIPDAPCGRWFEMSICADGEVSLCCMDGKAEYSLGNVKNQSLFEIYNKPEWRRNRVKMWSRANFSPCHQCSY